MSKHFNPAEISLAEFWMVILDGDHDVFFSLRDAEKALKGMAAGATIWHCLPGESAMRDITADLAQQWFEASEDVYDDAPDCYEPYIGADVRSRRDEYEERGASRLRYQHSTQYRGIGL